MTHAELIQLYANRFINHREIWFEQWIDDTGKLQYPCRKPGRPYYRSPAQAVLEHLQGKATASWPAINENGLSKWCAFDSDHENGHIPKVMSVLCTLGFTGLRESIRPGREGHLWLFFDEPVLASDLITFGAFVSGHAVVPMKAPDSPNGVEFFPSYATKLSQLRGGLGVHRKPGANNMRGWFADCDEQDVIEQLRWLAVQPLNSSARVTNIVRAVRAYGAPVDDSRTTPLRQSFNNERQSLLDVIPEMERRWNGHDWVARCPCCATEGHDRKGDNLRINPDGSFCCVYGGPGKTHSAKQIVEALRETVR